MRFQAWCVGALLASMFFRHKRLFDLREYTVRHEIGQLHAWRFLHSTRAQDSTCVGCDARRNAGNRMGNSSSASLSNSGIARCRGSVVFLEFCLWNEVGYFNPAADTKPLLHLWSLGV